MNKKIKVIIRELGRINTRSSFDYNMDNDGELLDKIAALIAEHHLKNPRALSYKVLKKNLSKEKKERSTQKDIELALENLHLKPAVFLKPKQQKYRRDYLRRKNKRNENPKH